MARISCRRFRPENLVRELTGAGGYARVQRQGCVAMATRRSLPPFSNCPRAHQRGINTAPVHCLNTARVQSVNNKLRLLTRPAFGFPLPAPLIALAIRTLGGNCPRLPSRL